MRPEIKYKNVKVKKPKLSPEEMQEAVRAKNLKRLEIEKGLSPTKVNNAILKHKGLLTQVSKALKVPRTTLIRYIEKHEVCLEMLGQARDEMGDIAENRLFQQIEAGDVRCLLYYLSTVHRHRGYGLNNADTPADPANRGPVYVDTINIVGIESGTFIPRETVIKENLVIEHQTDTTTSD